MACVCVHCVLIHAPRTCVKCSVNRGHNSDSSDRTCVSSVARTAAHRRRTANAVSRAARTPPSHRFRASMICAHKMSSRTPRVCEQLSAHVCLSEISPVSMFAHTCACARVCVTKPYLLQVQKQLLLLLVIECVRVTDILECLFALQCRKDNFVLTATVGPVRAHARTHTHTHAHKIHTSSACQRNHWVWYAARTRMLANVGSYM